MITYGVVSDTHGLVDPELPRLFRGVAGILHAGDIVGEHVVKALAQIAPVHAIVGNCDAPPLTRELPGWRVVELEGERILIVHDLGSPSRPRPEAARLIAQYKPTLVLSGHSHKGHLEVRDDVLYLNPGSAGRKRFKLLRSAALLVFKAREVEARLLSLEGEVGATVERARRVRQLT